LGWVVVSWLPAVIFTNNMYTPSLPLFVRRISLLSLVLALVLISTLAGTAAPAPAQAATVDDLSAQKAALEKKVQQAQAQAAQQKTVAQKAAEKVAEVSAQIGDIQTSVSQTQSTIEETNQEIAEKSQQEAELESELRNKKEQQNALVRALYIYTGNQNDNLALFSDQPMSKQEDDQAQLTALKRSVAAVYEKTLAAKAEVDKARQDLAAKNDNLKQLQGQQQQQQQALADMQQQQQALKEDAESAVVTLEAQANQAKAQEAKIEQQISAALSAAIAASNKGILGSGAGVGTRVAAGALVGHLGSTGNSTGPHVHFECRINNTPVSCQPYVDNGTVTWPVSVFTITQGFGYTDYASSGAYGGAEHTGIDCAGPYGEPVYAPAAGKGGAGRVAQGVRPRRFRRGARFPPS